MSLKLSELKALHDTGFSLWYLHPREKRPIGDGWTTAPRKSWDELEASFEKSYNVGVRLGETSKLKSGGYLACIDVDVKNPAYKGKALKCLHSLIKDKSLPIVLSGGGNGARHLYFATPKAFRQITVAKEKHKWEIVIYSSGRQMVLPMSTHPDTGYKYQWKDGKPPTRFPLLSLTDFELPAEKEEPKIEGALSFRAEEVDLYTSKLNIPTIKLITDGEGSVDRSAELLSIAMKMCRAGFTDNQILSVLSDENHWIADAAYEHTQSRSRDRAVKWLHKYTLLKARHETHPLRLFEGKADYTKRHRTLEKVEAEKAEIETEQKETCPDLDGNGKPKSTLRNVVHILEHFMGGGLVGFNEFSCRPYFLKDTLYGGVKGQELSDTDDLALKHYLSCHYRFEPSKELCFEAHTLLGQRYRFHPVKSYLERLEWDGVARLDSWLEMGFRASGPTEYVHAVGRKVLCAAVARIYEPGCKFDYMTVLEGNQGEGKSLSLGNLVGREWFVDSLGDIHNKDVVDQMMGKWLIEVSELDSIRGREAEAVKAFISRQVDRVRLSYLRRAQDYPRQCIFIGSTNDKEYLTDETGNRRYWPIRVGVARRKWLSIHRDQLWAEAKFRYELGEKLYLTPELEEVAKAEQEKRFEVDEWELKIKETLKDDMRGALHTTTEIWRAVMDGAVNGHPPTHEAKRVGKIMRRLGYERAVRRFDGVSGKCWVKP